MLVSEECQFSDNSPTHRSVRVTVMVRVRTPRRGSVRVRTPSRGLGVISGGIFGRGCLRGGVVSRGIIS